MNNNHPNQCNNVMPMPLTRRDLLKTVSAGFGWLALQGLAGHATAAQGASSLAVRAPHFAPRAKRVIFLCMQGGPSHLDTFDYKPALAQDDGKPGDKGKLFASPFNFEQRGQSGLWISDAFPNVAQHADDLCLLRGMTTDIPNHPQAFVQLHTGSTQFVRPSLGSWTLYGLGSENENLPGFVTVSPPIQFGSQNYGSAFLPAVFQGTRIGAQKESGSNSSISDIRNPELPAALQRKQLDLVQAMNRDLLGSGSNADIEGVIQSYELGFKMQTELPRVLDTATESNETLKSYGIGEGVTDSFGKQCLMARRLSEAGVRFVEVGHGGWDHHNNLKSRLSANCAQTDKPIAGLLADLKQRGLLKDTLVIWGGEFGRTPGNGKPDGRGHNSKGYTMWMAGGGVRGGFSHGATDEHGGKAVEDVMHVHDLHATVLALLGLDHEKLTYKYAGRDFRLTDVYGKVAKPIFA
ncbi:MAG: DUF1501 domain-containing protein [Chthoniobacteraceae bacterium]